MRRSIAALVAVVTLVAHVQPALAQQSETRECEQRLDAIRVTLDDDARRTRVWYWAWMAGGTALIVSQGIAAGLTTGDLQRETLLGSAASVFIPGFLLIHPPEVLSDAPRLDARLALTTVDGHVGDPCVALPRARELLTRDAKDEHFATAWYAHAFVIGGNIALGLILGIAFGDWLGFAKQAVGGTVIGEAQILTLPGVALQARGLGFGGSF
jgi:hypothetical protein